MNDEIKEDVSDLMELLETTSKKEFYRLTIDHELVVRLYNYISNLQQENKKYKEVIDKAIKKLEQEITFCENDSQGLYNKCNIAINRDKRILDILKERK